MNMRYLDEIKPVKSTAKIELLGKYSNTPDEIIEDPYFVGFFFVLLVQFEVFYELFSL